MRLQGTAVTSSGESSKKVLFRELFGRGTRTGVGYGLIYPNPWHDKKK